MGGPGAPQRTGTERSNESAGRVRLWAIEVPGVGRDREGLGWYASIAEAAASDMACLAPSSFRQGEIDERLGDAREAAASYARVVARWQECDPELRPLRDEAARRLVRLRARPWPR